MVTLGALITAPAGMAFAGVAGDTFGTAPVLYLAAAWVVAGGAAALAVPATRSRLALNLT